jgi:hypothetical protein
METKPGWKTSEFWLTMAAQVIGILLMSGAISNSAVLQGLGVAASVLTAMGYQVNRTMAKNATAKALTPPK